MKRNFLLAALLVFAVVSALPLSPLRAAVALKSSPAEALPPCYETQGRVEEGRFRSRAMYETVTYLVYLPPCYDVYSDRRFPVLYLFHGWPMNQTHWVNLGMTDLADRWIAWHLVAPFIIVMPGVGPDGFYIRTSGGNDSFEGMVVNELVPLIDETYRTWQDPAARAVGGISRGAVWSLEIGLRHPDLFGIIGAHSPALALNNPWREHDPYYLIRDGAPGQRLYLDGGTNDWANAEAKKFAAVAQEAGADVTLQTHVGAHVDALWASALGDYLFFYTRTWPDGPQGLPRIPGPDEVPGNVPLLPETQP